MDQPRRWPTDQARGALALSGLKVLDLSMNLPGPYLTWLLACLGAKVVKVENPQGGDYARGIGGQQGLGPHYFAAVNRNKQSLALDLKHPKGREALFKLMASHDVLVEGFRPGTMERLGLGFAELSAREPRDDLPIGRDLAQIGRGVQQHEVAVLAPRPACPAIAGSVVPDYLPLPVDGHESAEIRLR